MSKKNFLILFSGGFNSYVVTEFAIVAIPRLAGINCNPTL